jgi:futalosine hydrolase
MKIILTSATEFEISPTLAHFGQEAGIEFLITGVGLLATSVRLTQHLSQTKPYDWVINAGIAGSFRKDWALGKVVQVVQERLAYSGIIHQNGDLEHLENTDFGKNLPTLSNPTYKIGIDSAHALTSVCVHGEVAGIERVRNLYPEAEIESMEGAAFFEVCERLQVPQYLQIRALSNWVEPRDKSRWQLALSVKNLNDFLIQLIPTLRYVRPK